MVKPVLIYSVEGNPDIERMFGVYGFDQTKVLAQAEIVVFGGGADVHPLLYGGILNRRTITSLVRDRHDISVYNQTTLDQTLVGVCRGAQFLNVMEGRGTLWQDVNNHATGHHMAWQVDAKGKSVGPPIRVSSTHHQMMRPNLINDGEVVLASREATNLYGEGGDKPQITRNMTDLYDGFNDPEAVIYWKSRPTICFQPHPEYLTTDNVECTDYFFKLVTQYGLNKIQRERVEEVQARRLPRFVERETVRSARKEDPQC